MEENLFDQTRCISHEIRNQLSVCELYTKIIKKHLELESIENPSIDNALCCIEKSVRMINNSLLDLKLLNNFEIKTCQINSLLEQAVDLSRVYAIGKNVEFLFYPVDKCLVKVDENKFIACIVNILKNAVEAIEEKGKVEIFVEVRDGIVSIKFINNGKMISQDNHNVIFEKDFTTKRTGCGLGLHICKSSLQKMNGDLKLNYSTEKATEFAIILPVV